jgi:hypothetical protein
MQAPLERLSLADYPNRPAGWMQVDPLEAIG